jgi:hypothetical protein
VQPSRLLESSVNCSAGQGGRSPIFKATLLRILRSTYFSVDAPHLVLVDCRHHCAWYWNQGEIGRRSTIYAVMDPSTSYLAWSPQQGQVGSG